MDCRVCGRPREDHEGLFHAFSLNGSLQEAISVKGDDPQKGVPVSQIKPHAALRGDPVLRMILVREGLITADQLQQATEELQATGILYDVSTPGEAGRNSPTGEGSSTQ